MVSYPCDFCKTETATVTFNDLIDPQNTKFVGPECLPILGLMLVAPMEPVELDGALKAIGYQPTKALREARKAEELPEVDLNRTIGEVVESGPREDDGESVEPQGDTETDQPSDLSTNEPVPEPDDDPAPY